MGSAINMEVGQTILMIQGVLVLLHMPYFATGMKMFTHPMFGYGGPTGADSSYAIWLSRSWACWALIVGGPLLAAYNDKLPGDTGDKKPFIPPPILLVGAVSNILFGIFFGAAAFGCDGRWTKTEPTKINKLMLGSWCPTSILFGVLMLLSTDFDGVDTEITKIFYTASLWKGSIDNDVGKALLIVHGAVLLLHVIPFLVFGDKVMSHPLAYSGKEGMNDHTVFFARGYGCFATFVGGCQIAWGAIGGATPSVYLVYGISQIVFGTYFLALFTGLDGGHWKATKPTMINKLMLASWVPTSFLFGLIFIFCADFDEIPYDGDIFGSK